MYTTNTYTAQLAQAIETSINAEFAKGNDSADWIAFAIKMGAWDAVRIDLDKHEDLGDGFAVLIDGDRMFSIAEEADDDGSRWGWTTAVGSVPTAIEPMVDWHSQDGAQTVAELARTAAAWIAR